MGKWETILIVYDSLTGNVQRFVNKLNGFNTVKLNDNLLVNEPFVLVTYTIGFGEVPKSTAKFLEGNHTFLRGVACSGNMTWGSNYGRSGKLISEKYNVSFLLRFELSGTDKDRETFIREVKNIDTRTNTKLD